MTFSDHLLRWDDVVSDTENCVDLQNPSNPRYGISWRDDGAPMWVALKELRRIGWKGVSARVVHSSIENREFDLRPNVVSTNYLRVVLSLEAALTKNCPIESGLSQAYYDLVYKLVSVPANLSAEQYKKTLKALSDGGELPPLPPSSDLLAVGNG